MITPTQFGARMRLAPTRIRALCRQGRITGAVQLGRTWVLPDDARILPPNGRTHRRPRLTSTTA